MVTEFKVVLMVRTMGVFYYFFEQQFCSEVLEINVVSPIKETFLR